MGDNEENQDIRTVLSEIDLDEVPLTPTTTAAPSLSRKLSYLSTEVMQRVVKAIQGDECLPETIRCHLDSVDIAELTSCLSGINKIIQGGIFSAAIREQSWRLYQESSSIFHSAIKHIISSPPLSSLLCLQIAEELIRINMPMPSAALIQPTDLTTDEVDIIIYIAGFVLFRCKKTFSSESSCLKIVDKLIDNDGNSKMISVKSRGGLVQPVSSIIPFFVLIEIEFRSSCNRFQMLI